MPFTQQMSEECLRIIHSLIASIPRLSMTVAFLLVMFVLAGAIRGLVQRWLARLSHHPYAAEVIGRLARYILVVLSLLIATTILFPSFTPGSLVQLLGIGGVAVGFAFKDIFQNFLAGILLLITRPFIIGDQIVVDQFEGTVEDIQTRATVINTYDGVRIVMPNATLFTSPVQVYTVSGRRRLQFTVPFGAKIDIDHLRMEIGEAMRTTPGVLADPPVEVLLVQEGDGPVKLRGRWWVQTPIQHGAQTSRDQVLSAVVRRIGNPYALL